MKKKFYWSLQIKPPSTKIRLFIEFFFFLFILFVLVFPSILTSNALLLPKKHGTLQDGLFFLSKIFILAMSEELIYRVYLPHQMMHFYILKNKNDAKFKDVRKVFYLISNIFFAFAHAYLGIFNILFAFVLGEIFSLIYEYIGKKNNFCFAFFIISFTHFFYNSCAFWILVS